jgi:hypothetical protein
VHQSFALFHQAVWIEGFHGLDDPRMQPSPPLLGQTVVDFGIWMDGLDGPSSAAFGVGDDNKSLYIANAAFPFFPGPILNRRPSVMRPDVGIPGKPRP